MVVIAHLDVSHADVRADLAAFADDRIAFEDRPRIKDGVAADGDRRIYIGVIRIDDGNAIGHEFIQFTLAQDPFGFSHLLTRVYTECFRIGRRSKGTDDFACRYEHADDIGQIVFALRVVIGDVVKHIPQERHIKAVNAGVYFVDCQFFRRAVFLFDDFDDLPFFIADDAAVTGRIRHMCRQDRRCSAALFMAVDKGCKRFLRDQRRIATGYEEGASFPLEQRFCLQDSMACAKLFFLHDSFGLITEVIPDRFTAKPDDDDLALRPGCFDSPQYLFDHRDAADFVQNLGELRLHTRPLAGSEDKCNSIFHPVIASLNSITI